MTPYIYNLFPKPTNKLCVKLYGNLLSLLDVVPNNIHLLDERVVRLCHIVGGGVGAPACVHHDLLGHTGTCINKGWHSRWIIMIMYCCEIIINPSVAVKQK